MEERVMKLLQHYRHDILNELQLVHGYIQLGNVEKAEKILLDFFQQIHEERKLTRLHIPAFSLWLIEFNHRYPQYHLTYEVKANGNWHGLDPILLEKGKEIIDWCNQISDNEEHVYSIHIYLKEDENNSSRKILEVILKGTDTDNLPLGEETKDIFVSQKDDAIHFVFSTTV